MGIAEALVCGLVWWGGAMIWEVFALILDNAVALRVQSQNKAKTKAITQYYSDSDSNEVGDASYIDAAMYLSMHDE